MATSARRDPLAGRRLTPSASVAALSRLAPALAFRGRTRADWRRWRARFARALDRLLGPEPPRAPPRPRVLARAREAGYRREKIVIDCDAFSALTAWVLVPDGASPRDRRPAVLCAHGHGNGKDDVVGLARPGKDGDIYRAFGAELARAGFVVIAPDWRSFGERRDAAEFIGAWGAEHGDDGCDLSHLLYGAFGYCLLRLDACDAQRCIDHLARMACVDAARIGAMGLSFGGTMTAYVAALDRRVRAAVVSGYLSTLDDALGPRGRGNTCGSQHLPGLRAIGDIADVCGLIAPRPCQVQVGSRDACFVEADALRAHRRLAAIYRAAGAADALELDRFGGGHEVDLAPAIAFLRRWLQP